jgi:glycerol-3-phosphate acyltransferase PlsX
MVIAVDAMGGDSAPEAVVAGALLAAPQVEGTVILVGPAERIETLLRGHARPANLRVVDAPQIIGMDEDAGRAVKAKPDASLAVTVNLVRDGEADAAVSAGNSGAFMFLAQVRLRTIGDLQRPAIAVTLPGQQGPRVLLDAGANMDCRPRHLAEFALMGSIYAEYALGRQHPKVALLSIGEESCKGDEVTRAAHELLKLPSAPINFVGNLEGSEVMTADVDVIVADGFVGNVVLKMAEGTSGHLFRCISEASSRSLRTRVGRWLLRPVLREVRGQLDASDYGGALLLGVNGICVVGHGNSDARAVCNAILVAQRAVAGGVRERLAEGLQRLATAVNAAEKLESQTA